MEKSKHLQDQLRELKTEIDILLDLEWTQGTDIL
jgi:hypothetical protein